MQATSNSSEPLPKAKRLSELHPAIYHTRIFQKRLFRTLADVSGPGFGSYRRSGNKLREELIARNFSEVKYQLNFPAQQCSF